MGLLRTLLFLPLFLPIEAANHHQTRTVDASERCSGRSRWDRALAHPLPLSYVDVEARVEEEDGIVELIGEARVVAKTGVEIEAMTACAVAALTVYDMVKGVERGVRIEEIVLLEKTGGRSDWRLDDRAAE
jgi:Mlc titration factor MtfA (ptsG expression regulator)